MARRENYHPRHLSYYTTWWLPSKPSTTISATTLSVGNGIISRNQYIPDEQVLIDKIMHKEFVKK